MERQTQARGLTREESMAAYRDLSQKMGLRGSQRTALDYSPAYSAILNAAHSGRWTAAYALLVQASIIIEGR